MELHKKDESVTKHVSFKLTFSKYLFSIWFAIFGGIVTLFNSLGPAFDDKNLLLFYTSPPLWILEDYSYFLREFFGSGLFLFLRIVNTTFWFLVGMFIDWRVNKSDEVSIFKKVASMNLIIIFLIGILVLFSLVGTITVVIMLFDTLIRLNVNR